MDSSMMLMANVLVAAIFFGSITLCVRFDQQGKTRRRQLEHVERMRSLELGLPLQDGPVARYQALGAIGVAVAVSSFTMAAIGSCFALAFREPELRFGSLAVVWAVCGGVCVVILPTVLKGLRESRPVDLRTEPGSRLVPEASPATEAVRDERIAPTRPFVEGP